jgi:hypothetical protein
VELLPTLEQHPLGARAIRDRDQLLDVGLLVLAQRQADDVDVVLLRRAQHCRPQPQPTSSSVMPGCRPIAQHQVDLGDLRLFQRHVTALSMRSCRSASGQEQLEEVVGQVVVGLHVLEVWPQAPRFF